METDGQRHILLVDDESEVLSTVSFLLEAEGFYVTTAEDGKKALDFLEKSEKEGSGLVDLVVSDLLMPEMGGLELIDSISSKKIPVPVLVITGHGDKATVIDLMRRGCGDYLDKPFQPKDLVKRVNSLLGENVKRGMTVRGAEVPENQNPILLGDDSGWQIITPSGDIAGPVTEQLRALLVGLLDSGKLLYRFDFKNVNEITVDTLAVFLCFTRMLKEHYRNSKVEMLHANKYLAALLHSGEFTGVSHTNQGG